MYINNESAIEIGTGPNKKKTLYVKELKYCISLFRKKETKKNHCANLNHQDIVDNKKSWKPVKTLLSIKSKSSKKRLK